jgi:hypothetical protein
MSEPILPDLPPVLTAKNIADILQCSSAHVYQMVKEGHLRAIAYTTRKPTRSKKPSAAKKGTVRVLAEDFRLFLLNHRTGSEAG